MYHRLGGGSQSGILFRTSGFRKQGLFTIVLNNKKRTNFRKHSHDPKLGPQILTPPPAAIRPDCPREWMETVLDVLIHMLDFAITLHYNYCYERTPNYDLNYQIHKTIRDTV